MCGIAAVWSHDSTALGLIDEMTDVLTHRGPDDRGTFLCVDGGVALGMRRLSVVDITFGHQPMTSADGSTTLVFNGEIYNHRALRAELRRRGYEFQTDHSDTEVLLHGYREWQEGLFRRLNGMFAVVIYDQQQGRLVVARDRFGEKPVFIGRWASGVAIASELKSLMVLPQIDRRLDRQSLQHYLALDYVPAPRSILSGVEKLPAAHFAVLDESGLRTQAYWSPDLAQTRISAEEATGRLDELLSASVAARLDADVPVGLLLSGGLDSSTIGWYMTRLSKHVESFSIGFGEAGFDESAYAEEVATALGTRHHARRFGADDVTKFLSRLPTVLDEPMGDQSILPTLLVSQVARERVTVALGGDGSDELLLGYNSFRPLKLTWLLAALPKWVRAASVTGVHALRGAHPKAPLLEDLLRSGEHGFSELLMRHLGAMRGDPGAVLSRDFVGNLDYPADLQETAAMVAAQLHNASRPDLETVGAYLKTYLQDDILVKVDRASMAFSLEVRSPFLDNDVSEFALRLPTDLKLNRLTGKFVLRKLMSPRLPASVNARRKMGFGAPVSEWLRHEMRPVAEEAFAEHRLNADGVFDAAYVRQLWNAHLSSGQDNGRVLWSVLLCQLWLEHWNIVV